MSNQNIIVIYIITCNCENIILRNIIKLKSFKKDLSKIETTVFIIKIFKFQKYLNIISINCHEVLKIPKSFYILR